LLSLKGGTVLSRVVLAARRLLAAIGDSATAVLGSWRRRVWLAHLERLAEDPAYAAAGGAVLAGLLGLAPPREVLAALLTIAASILLRGRPGGGRTDYRAHPWTDG
jgi:hypothetical protein